MRARSDRRGCRGRPLPHLPGADVYNRGLVPSLSSVVECAGGYDQYRGERGVPEPRGCRGVTSSRGVASGYRGGLAKLQQNSDIAALLAVEPDQYEERRPAEGIVYLRHPSIRFL